MATQNSIPENIDFSQQTTDRPSHLERRLLWKVDLLLMPILTFSYGLQFYDKFVFSSAAASGMLNDLHLTTPVPGSKLVSTHRYSTATAAFYWGYIIGVLPIALVLQRFPIAKALSLLIFVWGAIVILTVVVSSYPGAVAQRFFLGLVESSVSPGFVLVTSMWYTPRELPVRLGIWYSATGIFTIFSGSINYAIGQLKGSLAPWKYMYLVAGSITMFWAFVVLGLLPDTPAIAPKWLFTPQEQTILTSRATAAARMHHKKAPVIWIQVREAIRDPQIWALGAMGASIYVCNGGVTAFGSLIIKSFGYTSLRAILLQAPGGATTCIAIYLSTWIAGRLRNAHTLLIPLTCIPVLIGAIILWRAPWHPRGWPLFGYYLLPTFGAPYVLLLALLGANVRGRTKRTFGAGAVFIGYNVGNIIGPYLVDVKEAPEKYRTTWIAIIICMCFTIVTSLFLRVYYQHENAARVGATGEREAARGQDRRDSDEKDDCNRESGMVMDQNGDEERTDRQNAAFRYVL